MVRMTRKYLVFCLLAAGLVLVLSGCSKDYSPVSSEEAAINAQPHAGLAPLSSIGLSTSPSPHFMILQTNWAVSDGQGSALDGWNDPWYAHRWINHELGGTVLTHHIGCTIPPNALPADADVSVTIPIPGYAMLEFGPHPTAFASQVTLFIDMWQVWLPEGVTWEDLQMWYVNDNGGYEPIRTEIDQPHHMFYAYTSHFSRYIVGAVAQ
jgi:hypothetical protein